MALPIIEEPIYGQMTLETAAWSTTFTWVDRTAYIVGGVSYAEGGRVSWPGQSQVDVGTLVATFKDLTTVPVVGDLVRLRRTGTSEYAFTGYVQDVGQRVVFDQSVSLSTPVVLTTIYCSDWVGYVSQFQLQGIGGADASSGTAITSSVYEWSERVAAINKAIDATYATKMVGHTYTTLNYAIGDTDMVGTISDHLDLIANTDSIYWYGNHILPTNNTTGRDDLVWVRDFSTAPSSGKTFTDVLGSAGQLHYLEIDFENSTQNVANTIVARNRVRFKIPTADVEVTKLGGFNEENYVVVNGVNTVGIGIDSVEQKSDTTSITTYGNRQAEVDINASVNGGSLAVNLIANPSVEYSDDGYSHGGTVNGRVRRRKPSEDANPFSAFSGLWAMRSRVTTAALNTRIDYSGGESDGIPAVAGTTYYFKARAARGTVSRTDVQAQTRVIWYDDTETQIGATVTGANVALTTANTWYEVTSGAIVAPANTVRAAVHVFFTRSGGGNHTVGDRLWADAYQMSKTNIGYFDGDTQPDTSYLYIWTGGVGASPSYRVQNKVDDVAAAILARYSTTSMRATRIRWNAQEDMTAVSSLYVGSTVSIVYKGTTTTYRIVGINGNISPDRYVIDYYIAKV